MADAASTKNVLDRMVAGIVDVKDKKAATLTPVGMERRTVVIPDVPGGVFLANEAVTDISKDLRRQAAVLIEVADGLDRTTGSDTAAPVFVDKVALAKAAEKEADEKAAATAATKTVLTPQAQGLVDHMQSLAVNAKAAAFAALDDTEPESPFNSLPHEAPAVSGWACPTHKDSATHQLKSRKGRAYSACAVDGCDAFQKD